MTTKFEQLLSHMWVCRMQSQSCESSE